MSSFCCRLLCLRRRRLFPANWQSVRLSVGDGGGGGHGLLLDRSCVFVFRNKIHVVSAGIYGDCGGRKIEGSLLEHLEEFFKSYFNP